VSRFIRGDIATGVAFDRGKLRRELGVTALIAVQALCMSGPALADEFDRRHKDLLGRQDLQFAFTPEEIPEPPPSWLRGVAEFFRALGPIFEVIFWGALALMIGAIVWFIAREFWNSRFGRNPKIKDKSVVQVTDYRPEPARARALLEEADRLAAEGRFDEAARTLLHRSIADIEERIPQSIKKAQTSREIAGLDVLPDVVRHAFRPITRAVEQSWFGGRPLNAESYQACRKAYADFALPESWGAPQGRLLQGRPA
jgi:hypothetical protein